MLDQYGRKIEYMRISLTDRCNLRCKYCMPCDLPFIPHENILSYEEIYRICDAAVSLGINCFKITGGEPFVRKGSVDFMRKIKGMPGVEQVTVTTNGVLLQDYAEELSKIGMDGVNVSLDTASREKFLELTGKDYLPQVLEGIQAAYKKGLHLKINCVPLKTINEEGVLELLCICEKYNIDVRFIELMPIGYGKAYAGISLNELEEKIHEIYPEGNNVTKKLGNGPARYYHPNGFQGNIGFIDAIHGKFCDKCNRVRLTSEGFLKTCLYCNQGVSLREAIRSGANQKELLQVMRDMIEKKPKEHHFYEKKRTEEESRKMSQIGG